MKENNQGTLHFNFGWLSASHGINIILPLFIYPYALRIIGVEHFGIVMFAQALVLYFVNVVDYGYSLSGIRDVSVNRSNSSKLNEIFSTVFFTKMILVLLSTIPYGLILILFNKAVENQTLFITTYLMVIGQWLLPFWFFQGLEKMKLVALLNILSKLIFLALIIMNVRLSTDYKLFNLWLGISQVFAGLAGTMIVIFKYKVKIRWYSFNTIIVQLKINFLLFISNFSAFVSSNSSLVILAIIAEPQVVGYFAIAERILVALKAPAVLLYQTVYPRLCTKAEDSMQSLISFSRQITIWVYLLFIPLGVVTCLFAKEIIYLFSGSVLEQPIGLLYIMSAIPLIVALNIPATQALIAYKLNRSYATITISGGVINLFLNIILVSIFMANGAAWAALLTEICVTTVIYITISRKLKEYAPMRVLNWS